MHTFTVKCNISDEMNALDKKLFKGADRSVKTDNNIADEEVVYVDERSHLRLENAVKALAHEMTGNTISVFEMGPTDEMERAAEKAVFDYIASADIPSDSYFDVDTYVDVVRKAIDDYEDLKDPYLKDLRVLAKKASFGSDIPFEVKRAEEGLDKYYELYVNGKLVERVPSVQSCTMSTLIRGIFYGMTEKHLEK